MIEADKEELLKSMKEISASMTRMEAEKDYIKEEKKALCEKFELKTKVLTKVIRAYHKGNKDEEKAVCEDFEALYEEVVS